MRKFNFNMVEIALAMVIIAIGISGILGLFSVGVNSRKSAISENNIANAAEYILGLYRAVIVEKYDDSAVGNNIDLPEMIKSIKNKDDIDAEVNKEQKGNASLFDFFTGFSMPVDKDVKSYLYGQNGNFDPKTATALPDVFVYAPSRIIDHVRVADCEIAGVIWRAPIDVVVPKNSSSGSGSVYEKKTMPESYGVRIYLELSWPLSQKYESREKKLFVMDIVNPKPTLAQKTSSQTN